jgi:type VI secretion system secreted protein Hcp
MWFPNAAAGGMLSAAAAQPKGETQDDWMSKVNAFEISDFSFGVTQAQTIGSASGGSGGGKASFNEFTVKKFADLGSVPIFTACTVGAHFPYVFLAVRKAGGVHLIYLQYIFAQVFVTSISWSGSGGDEPFTEEIKFKYGALGIQYVRQDATGQAAGAPMTSLWSVVTNAPSLVVPGLPAAPQFINPSQA